MDARHRWVWKLASKQRGMRHYGRELHVSNEKQQDADDIFLLSPQGLVRSGRSQLIYTDAFLSSWYHREEGFAVFIVIGRNSESKQFCKLLQWTVMIFVQWGNRIKRINWCVDFFAIFQYVCIQKRCHDSRIPSSSCPQRSSCTQDGSGVTLKGAAYQENVQSNCFSTKKGMLCFRAALWWLEYVFSQQRLSMAWRWGNMGRPSLFVVIFLSLNSAFSGARRLHLMLWEQLWPLRETFTAADCHTRDGSNMHWLDICAITLW